MRRQKATSTTLGATRPGGLAFRNAFRILACSLLLSPLSVAQTPSLEATSKDTTSTDQMQSIIARAAKTVVRIKTQADEYASSGVIVTDDGHIIWSGSSHQMPDMTIVLPTGELVPATNLGWSTEWQIGLCRVKAGKWPHAEFGSTKDVMPGDPCFEIGFHTTETKQGDSTSSQQLRSGNVSFVSPSHWFATNLKPTQFEYGAATFDRGGKLLGISVPGVSVNHHLSTAIEVVTSNWQPLADGKNLDWIRYPPSKDSVYKTLAGPNEIDRTGAVPRKKLAAWNKVKAPVAANEEDFGKARRVAAATTVRIRRGLPANPEKQPPSSAWSGVIVSADGLIATCAHTGQLAGEKLTVVLPDNRQVPAVALGTNWVSDVGIVKITEEGHWNHAELGDSSALGPDGAVLCAGFPVPDVNPLPPVTTEVLGLQQTPYVGWNHEIMVALSLKLSGGASGGGVFDREGKLVAISLGYGPGNRIEMFRAQQDYLKREKDIVEVDSQKK
jgi:S1-C subfamily serine protease